jgi:hypothetical protein
MKQYAPFALAIAGVLATVAILFLVVRIDAWPRNIRGLEWRRAIGDPAGDPAEPVEAA